MVPEDYRWTDFSHKIRDNLGGNGNRNACNLSLHNMFLLVILHIGAFLSLYFMFLKCFVFFYYIVYLIVIFLPVDPLVSETTSFILITLYSS